MADKNTRLTLRQWLEREGLSNVNEAIAEGILDDSIVPALCREGCQVEPDGHCEHGHPSVMLVMGVI